MSKHNYSQYSNNNKKKYNNAEASEVAETVTTVATPDCAPALEIKMEPEATIAETVAETIVETVTLPKTVKGTVVNCARLNVRAKPKADADVLEVIGALAKVTVDATKSNNEWLAVRTENGVNGYCMRKFVDARL